MKKEYLILLVVIVVVLGLGYVGRHKIKSMLGMSPPPAPTTATAMMPEPTSGTGSPAAMAPSNNIYTTKTDTTKGDYLADFDGKTLYTFDSDTAGVSNCNGGCATAWPPYTSGATAQSTFPANISVVTRADKSTQFAWKGMPLYYFGKDQKAGDTLGDGVGGKWHIVKP